MTSDFDARHRVGRSSSDQFTNRDPGDRQPPEVLDVMKRDRFELLSAYLDGEVTAEERRLVEGWLAQDSTVQQLYQRLLRLRQGIQSCPVPASVQPAEITVEQVLKRANRRPRRFVVLGGGAIAAIVVGALSSLILNPESPLPQVATSPSDSGASTEALQIALDQPIMEIPKAPESTYDSENPSLYQPNNDIR